MGKNDSEPLALMTSHKLGTIMTKLRVVASYGGCHLEGAVNTVINMLLGLDKESRRDGQTESG